MEVIFDSLSKPIYDINHHKGYVIQWKLIAPFCRKWCRNRDPDLERVNEMVEHHKKNGYIPRMIHLAEIKGEGIVCYDGNHRKEVFNMCSDESVMCIVDIMFDTNDDEVYKAFININKSVQLPAIYMDEINTDASIKTDILNLVRGYETRYKEFLSTSSMCHAPHFNRDTLTDNIYKSFGGTISIEQIGKLLNRLNIEYSQGRICRSHLLYKEPLLNKCRKYNMWLFMEKTIPFEHVEKMIAVDCGERLTHL